MPKRMRVHLSGNGPESEPVCTATIFIILYMVLSYIQVLAFRA